MFVIEGGCTGLVLSNTVYFIIEKAHFYCYCFYFIFFVAVAVFLARCHFRGKLKYVARVSLLNFMYVAMNINMQENC